MSLKDFCIENISRVIAHTVNPKTVSSDAYADTSNEFLNFSVDEKTILISRLEDALGNSKKTFRVEYEDYSPSSIYTHLKDDFPFSDEKFMFLSVSLANKLASSHFRIKIPGGYCLIGDGVSKNGHRFFFVIKAELQEVFSIKGNLLEIVKDVFLSPAKDFYKIGFFVDFGKGHVPYMYDDQFSPQKKDLTEYFYSKFLGLTTDKNDRILSKNFYSDTRAFIEDNISEAKDRIGLIKALTVLYREETSGIISPSEFSEKYLEGEVKSKYDKMIKSKYPLSFTKDVSLIKTKLELKRISIPLSYGIDIIGNSDYLDDIEIIENPNCNSMRDIEPEINSGQIKKIVLLKEKKATSESLLEMIN
jgi:hypothetical protein